MQTLLVLLIGGAAWQEPSPPNLTALDHAALIDSGNLSDASIPDAGDVVDASASSGLENAGDVAGVVSSADSPSGSTLALLIGVLITLLVTVLRSSHAGGVVQNIPARWRAFVPAVLSLLAGAGSAALGVPVNDALLIGLFSGPTAVFAHETVSEGVLNRRRSRAVTARWE